MKKQKIYLLFLILIFGCNNKSDIYNSIIEAEKQVCHSPQNAQEIINSLDIDYYELDEQWQARYTLLRCSIAYKTDADYPFLDQVIHAKKWFFKKKEYQKGVQTGLFLAICLQNDKNNEAAHREYLEGLTKAIQSDYYNEAGYISSHLGDFYYANDDINAALLKYVEANSYFHLCNNQLSVGFSFRDIGRSYCLLDSINKALCFMEKADSIADVIGSDRLKASVYNGLGNIALYNEEYAKAIHYLEEAILIDSIGYLPNKLAISDIYIANEEYRKANVLLDSLNRDDLPEKYKKEIYYNRYLIDSYEANYKEALLNFERFFDLFENNRISSANENYIEVEKKYNHYVMVTKIQELTIRNQTFLLYIILLIAIICILFIIYQYIHSQNRKKLYLKDKLLKETQTDILNLSYELERKNNELNRISKEKGEYKKREAEITTLKQKITESRNNFIYYSPLLKELTTKMKSNKYFGKEVLTSKIWKNIEKEAEIVFPGFISTLEKEVPILTKEEVQYCCLCIYGFDSNQEAILLNITPESVRKKRTKIRKKFNISLADSNLHLFLKSYFAE